jgi:hypothetical protein
MTGYVWLLSTSDSFCCCPNSGVQVKETFEGDWEVWVLRLMEILETGASLHYLPQKAALSLLRKVPHRSCLTTLPPSCFECPFVQVSQMPLRRDKWLLEVAKERVFLLLKQHAERGDTGELLEQALLTLASFKHKGVAAKAVELCAFVLKR